MSSILFLVFASALVSSRSIMIRDPAAANMTNSTAGHNRTSVKTSEVEVYLKSSAWRTFHSSSDTQGTVVTCAMLLCPIFLCVIPILCCMDETDSQPQHRPQGRTASKYGQAPILAPMASTSSNMSPQAVSALSASAPLSGYFGDAVPGLERKVLCPEFVVSEPNGVVFTIPDMFMPSPQTLTMDIRDQGGVGRVVAQAVATEPLDNFVRLETSYPSPAVVAVLDTTFSLQSASAAGTRYAILRRTLPDGRMDELAAPFAVFFLNKTADGASLVARCGDSPGRSRPLITAILDTYCKIKVVYDAAGRPLAIREGAPDTWNGGTAIRVQPVTDAALIFCCVIAAQKLR